MCAKCPTIRPPIRHPPELPKEKLITGTLNAPITQPKAIATKNGKNPNGSIGVSLPFGSGTLIELAA